MLLTFLSLSFSLFILISITYYSYLTGISPMPVGRRERKVIYTLFDKAKQGPSYNLGSGFGTLIIPLALSYPERRFIAYELSLIPYLFSLSLKYILKLDQLDIRRKDFFQEDLSEAKVILSYLYPGAMQKLSKKLKEELKDDAIVISSCFSLPQWKAKICIDLTRLIDTKVYLYRLCDNSKEDRLALPKEKDS